jgi:hypothetical protein
MATYPTFVCGTNVDSMETTLDDVQIDRASNGVPRLRAYYTAPKKAFTLVHAYASAAEKSNLLTFYNTNRLITFSLVWAGDGATYTCYFSAAPLTTPLPGQRWEITTLVVQA